MEAIIKHNIYFIKLLSFLIGYYTLLIPNTTITNILLIGYLTSFYFKVYGIVSSIRILPITIIILENIIVGVLFNNFNINIVPYIVVSMPILLIWSLYKYIIELYNSKSTYLIPLYGLVTIISIYLIIFLHSITLPLILYTCFLILNIAIRFNSTGYFTHEWNYDILQLLFSMIIETKNVCLNFL